MTDAPGISQIGSWLRAARTRQGKYSQEKAAHAIGSTARTLWSWEQGEAAPPADAFLRLVVLYGADVAELLPPPAVEPPAWPAGIRIPDPLHDAEKPGRRKRGA